MPYDANEDHYGCPVPVNPLTGEVNHFTLWIDMYFFQFLHPIAMSKVCIFQVEKRNWWTELWFQSLYEAEVVDAFLQENKPFNASTFRSSVNKFMEKR